MMKIIRHIECILFLRTLNITIIIVFLMIATTNILANYGYDYY